jgi:hypothetical protein
MRRQGIMLAAALAVVLSSKSPYWKVGPRDADLSRACAMGRFGVVDPGRWQAHFRGAEGPETLVVGKGNGQNLRDPDKRAKAKEDYFFRRHGTSECEVFVGGRKG